MPSLVVRTDRLIQVDAFTAKGGIDLVDLLIKPATGGERLDEELHRNVM